MTVVAKLPEAPHSVEAEQSLIGAVLLDPKAWSRVAARVNVADFYRADHRLLWSAVCSLAGDGKAADPTAVIERLSRASELEACGGRDYIARLYADTPSATNIETYAAIVREHASMRRLREVGHQVARLADRRQDQTAAQAYEEASRLFGELYGKARIGRGLVESRVLVGEVLDDLDRRRAGERGLSVGLHDLDALSYGLDPGDLVVIAGRPGMGKTALLVSIAGHVSEHAGVAVFSAEMPSKQLMRRAVALYSGIAQTSLRQPAHLDDSQWQSIDGATGLLAERRLWVDDTPSPTLEHVRGEVLALTTRVVLGLVMVDYVQLVQGHGNNRYEQLRDVAYGLKALAKEARVPIILLAQLNRGIENREAKRPRLSDLRDSGAIEEAADIVGMLYSEGYYDPEFSMPDVLECGVEKNRNGERGRCLWRFTGETSRVVPLEPGAREHYRHMIAKAAKRGGDDL